MEKWHGAIGFAKSVLDNGGVSRSEISEKMYYGDFVRSARRWSPSSDSTMDDLFVNNQLEIVADNFAKENFQYMKYVVYKGIKWKISSVDIGYPRFTIYIGGVYNG